MSIGKWILKTFDDTNVDAIKTALQQLQTEVAQQQDLIRKYQESENSLKQQNQALQNTISITNNRLNHANADARDIKRLLEKERKQLSCKSQALEDSLRTIDTLKKKFREEQQHAEQLADTVQRLNNGLRDCKSEKEALSKSYKDKLSSITRTAEEQENAIKQKAEECNNLKSDNHKLIESLDSKEAEIVELQKETELLKSQNITLKEELAKKEKGINDLQEQIDHAKTVIEVLTKEKRELLSKHESETNELDKKVRTYKAAYKNIQTELCLAIKEEDTLKQDLTRLELNYEILQKSSREEEVANMNRIKKQEETIASLNETIKSKNSNLEQVKQSYDNLKNSLENYKSESINIQEKEKAIASLKETIEKNKSNIEQLTKSYEADKLAFVKYTQVKEEEIASLNEMIKEKASHIDQLKHLLDLRNIATNGE